MSKLDETKNFIDLHMHACGRSEVPIEFHRWAAITLIAAAVQDRAWVMKFSKPLFPNLYTFLIGPSGCGKDAAISAIGRLAKEVPEIKWTNTKRSAQSLLDKMSMVAKEKGVKELIYPNRKLCIVMPELAMSIGTGKTAQEFVKHMTGLYTGSEDIGMLDEGTRTSGEHKVPPPLINWIVGTTKEWLLDSITKEDLYGGFIARTVCVLADYDFSPEKRVYKPKPPADAQEVNDYLYARLYALVKMKPTEIKLSTEADHIMEHWYYNRESPDPDDPLTPTWKREHDMVLKLCVIFALANQRTTILPEDFHMASKLQRQLMAKMPELLMYASTTPQTEAVHRARAILRRAGGIKQDMLLRRLGITADHLSDVIETLEKSQMIKIMKSGKGTVFNPYFQWIDVGGTNHITVEDDGNDLLDDEDEGAMKAADAL